MFNSASAPRPSILIVDDDASVGVALTAALQERYTVFAATTGVEALAIQQTQHVAAVILDAILQDGEDGLKFVKPLQAIAPVPVVLLTGHSSEELAIRAAQIGVAGYLKKPPTLGALYDTLERVLVPQGWFTDPAIRARCHLDTHLDTPAPARIVAGELRLSDRHTRRLFRQTHGRNLRQYLAQARLQRAEALLRTTNFSIDRVARECGWRSVPTFIRTFRRVYRLTPARFRALLTPPGVASSAN